MNNTENDTMAIGRFRPKLSFFHPNARGTGGAIEMELHPAHDDTDGSIMLRLANQLTVGDRTSANPVFPRFDWENAITIRLDFDDLCAFLQVLRGECESINDKRGIFHNYGGMTTKILFSHMVDETSGYLLEAYRNKPGNDESLHACFRISGREALGICEAIAGSMSIIAFGIPMLVPKREGVKAKGVRNAAAA